MCNTLELSGLFASPGLGGGGLVKFFGAWGNRKYCFAVLYYGGISTQADTMDSYTIFTDKTVLRRLEP